MGACICQVPKNKNPEEPLKQEEINQVNQILMVNVAKTHEEKIEHLMDGKVSEANLVNDCKKLDEALPPTGTNSMNKIKYVEQKNIPEASQFVQ